MTNNYGFIGNKLLNPVFFWVYLESKVYINKSKILVEVKNNIQSKLTASVKVLEDFNFCMKAYRRARGGLWTEVIFDNKIFQM